MSEFTGGPLTLAEMLKIVSLLENPPEAAMVRKALRFYEVPERLHDAGFKWGQIEDIRKVMMHYLNPQNPDELDWMLDYVKGATSLLEVGSSFGGTLAKMASVMKKGAKIVSVDAAMDETPLFLNPAASLKETCRQIAALGASVELLIGDSHSSQVVDRVSHYAPFDFVFIDGDHTYDGVKADWENYGPMGTIVGFHDIGCVPEVNRFWEELKAKGNYRIEEQMAKEKGFGIGVVFRED